MDEIFPNLMKAINQKAKQTLKYENKENSYCKQDIKFSSVAQSCLFSSVAQSCLTCCDPMNRSTPGLPVPSPTPGVHSDSTSIESVMPSIHLILCRPLLLLPPIPPTIRVFYNESTLLMRWPKYWSFSFSIIPSKEHPGHLII